MSDTRRPILNGYDPEYLDKVDEYLKEREDKEYEFHKTRGDKSDSYEEKVKVKLPSKEDFADWLGVSRKTLYNWSDDNPEFAFALEKIHNAQHARLVNGGLDGTYNSTIAKLMLTSNHGYKDQADLTSGGKPLPLLDYVKTGADDSDETNTGTQ